jgi:hypothetical protein
VGPPSVVSEVTSPIEIVRRNDTGSVRERTGSPRRTPRSLPDLSTRRPKELRSNHKAAGQALWVSVASGVGSGDPAIVIQRRPNHACMVKGVFWTPNAPVRA